MNFVQAMAAVDDGEIVSNNFNNKFYLVDKSCPDNLIVRDSLIGSEPLKVADRFRYELVLAKWRIVEDL